MRSADVATQGVEVARCGAAIPGRSAKHALERSAILRLAVRGQHELDRQVEQRADPSDDIVARHVLATAELNVQSVAEVIHEGLLNRPGVDGDPGVL
jgi:hypothetical protein